MFIRKALVVGVDEYSSPLSRLHYCVDDARAVASLLERHYDGRVNFDVRLITASDPSKALKREKLKAEVKELFSGDQTDTALFYFAGHGHVESTGGYLCCSDAEALDDGLPLAELMSLANRAKAHHKIILLDSCHAGSVASNSNATQSSELYEGMCILAASTAAQSAVEEKGSGVFTSLLVDALSGAAANVLGEVTPGAAYAHIDQALGSNSQRPVFKTNVQTFVSLRQTEPPIELRDLQRILEFFPTPSHRFTLDPEYEPTSPAPDSAKTAVFDILQKYNRVGLVVPVNAKHMYYAAMEGKACKLTALGEHYRRLVQRKVI